MVYSKQEDYGSITTSRGTYLDNNGVLAVTEREIANGQSQTKITKWNSSGALLSKWVAINGEYYDTTYHNNGRIKSTKSIKGDLIESFAYYPNGKLKEREVHRAAYFLHEEYDKEGKVTLHEERKR